MQREPLLPQITVSMEPRRPLFFGRNCSPLYLIESIAAALGTIQARGEVAMAAHGVRLDSTVNLSSPSVDLS